MTTGTLLGQRRDGRPIFLAYGGADDEPEGGNVAPPPAPAAPAPQSAAPGDGWTPPTREEAERAAAEREVLNQQLAQLKMLLVPDENSMPPSDEDEDEEPRNLSEMPPAERKLYREVKSLRLEAKRKREQAEAQLEEAAQKQKADADKLAAEAARRKLAEDMQREATAAVAPFAIEARATPALIAAGADAKQAETLARYLDHSRLTVDLKTRQVSGLDEEIARLKTELPQLFAPPESDRRPYPKAAVGDRPPVAEKPLTTAEKIARQVLGGAA